MWFILYMLCYTNCMKAYVAVILCSFELRLVSKQATILLPYARRYN